METLTAPTAGMPNPSVVVPEAIQALCAAVYQGGVPRTTLERAALALAEAVTRLSDRADPVPDPVRDEAARTTTSAG